MDRNLNNEESTIGLTALTMGLCLLSKYKTMERRWWERPHLGIENRSKYGQQNLLNQMRLSDVESFASIVRFRPESFDKLLSIVGPMITHYSNRQPINPSTRLAVTLRYLATGESMKSLSYNYRLGESTTNGIIKETVIAIYNSLKPLVMPELTTERWLEIAEGFHRRWNVPNCGGSLDGKHIRTKRPAHSGSEFWNFKNYFSTVLMAICDADYKFVAADTGCQGRNNDAVVLNDSKIGQKLINGTFNLPGEKEIMYGPKIPHFLLGDEIFGLKPYLMVPYPGRSTGKLNYVEQVFNYRQSRGRRVIENAFGILSSVWRIFLTQINETPETVDAIVMAAVCLHNFRIMENESLDESDFVPSLIPTREVQSRLQSIDQELFPHTDSSEAELIRDELAQYFVTAGHVYWQDDMVRKGY